MSIDFGPLVIVIGTMKAGTTSLHRYLDVHPAITMAPGKELNFFFDPESGGNWHRGPRWYDSALGRGPIRGEASPGYTSPDHPEVADRMATMTPNARLVMLTRDPLDRAVSQYHHHVRDGTELRPIDVALLDPASQYIARSRYFDRLRPFLRRFPIEQLLLVDQTQLHDDPAATMRLVYQYVGADPNHPSPDFRVILNSGRHDAQPSADTAARFRAAVCDDQAALRQLRRTAAPTRLSSG